MSLSRYLSLRLSGQRAGVDVNDDAGRGAAGRLGGMSVERDSARRDVRGAPKPQTITITAAVAGVIREAKDDRMKQIYLLGCKNSKMIRE